MSQCVHALVCVSVCPFVPACLCACVSVFVHGHKRAWVCFLPAILPFRSSCRRWQGGPAGVTSPWTNQRTRSKNVLIARGLQKQQRQLQQQRREDLQATIASERGMFDLVVFNEALNRCSIHSFHIFWRTRISVPLSGEDTAVSAYPLHGLLAQ